MKNIIIFGPPGTGKGTMSKKLAEEFGLKHISTGDIIRKNQEEKTKIGQLADKIVNDGNLLPDDIVNEMIKQEIIDDKTSPGFIFDGFPRTPGQAKMLDQFLNRKNTPVSAVIYLDVPKWVAIERIVERGKTSNRKDDTEEAFPTRWNAYQKDTIPAMNYFEGRGKVTKISSEQSIDEVYAEIKKVIDGIN
ncbi:MAG: adenylate kinase [Nanoarchaeota archaeon]